MADPKKIADLTKVTSLGNSDSIPASSTSLGYDVRIEAQDFRNDLNAPTIENVEELKTFEGKRDGQVVNLLSYTSDYKGGGPVIWNSTSTDTADDGMIFQVTGVDTGRWERPDLGYVDLAWYGFEGTGDEYEKFQASLDFGRPIISNNNRIRLETETTVDQSDIILSLQDTTIIQGADNAVLSINGDWATSQNVTEIDTVSYSINGNTPATNVTRLTLDATPTVAQDDVIKLFSSDRIPKTSGVPTDRLQRMGHFGVVSGIDSGSNYVYLTGVIPESGLYTTSVKVAKLNRYETKIKGLNVEVDGTFSASAIALNSCHSPEIDGFECLEGSHRPLLLKSCYAYKVNNVNCEDIDTESGSRQGYAVFDLGCGYGRVTNISGSLLRHVFSNDADYVHVDDIEPERCGWSHDAIISNGVGISCTHAAWDTHTAAYNTTFNNCNSIDSHSGKESSSLNSPGSGIQARGWLTKFNDCNVRGGRYPVRIAPETEQNITGIDKPICIINGGEYECDQLYLLRVESDTGFTNDNIIFNNITYIHRGSAFIASIEGKCGVRFNNVDFRIQTGAPTDFQSIISVDDGDAGSNVTINGMDIYDDVDATTRRLFLLQDDTIGKMRARGVRIHSTTNWNRLVRLTASAGTGGEVDIEAEFIGAELSSTVADNAEHLSVFKYSQLGDGSSSEFKSVNLTANSSLPEIEYIKSDIAVSITNDGAYDVSAIPSGQRLGQILTLSNLSGSAVTVVDGGTINLGSNESITQYSSLRMFWNGTDWIKG